MQATCKHPNCDHTALYSSVPNYPQFCGGHASRSMIFSQELCLARKCGRKRLYGVRGGRTRYCYTHRIRAMVLHLHRCRTVGCFREAVTIECLGGKPTRCPHHIFQVK